MGRIFSCLRKPKKKKNVRIVKVLPAGNSEDGPQKIDYGVFCVANNQQSSSSTIGKTGKEEAPEASVRDHVVVTEENAMAMLKKEGLVSNLKGLSSKGLAFEIVEETREAVVPPARLEGIIRTKEQKQEPKVEEIKERLFEAERRRKQLEEERIVRVRAMKRSSQTDGAINAFIAQQKALENHQTKRMEDAVASRQSHLREIRDKLKAKREHEKRVRKRKELNLDELDPRPPEYG